MKPIYTLISIILLSSFTLSANHPNFHRGDAELRIEFPSGHLQYAVQLNGQLQRAMSGFVHLQNLTAGRHQIQVGYLSGFGRNARLIPIYSGGVVLKPNSILLAQVNHRGMWRMMGYEPLRRPVHPIMPPSVYAPQVCPTPQVQPLYLTPMNPQNFNLLLNSIRSKPFESDKLIIAQQALRYEPLSSLQVKHIMDEFNFEDTKINFAIYAYEFCVDPQRYFVVNDAFNFSSSIRKLEQQLLAYR